MGLLEMSVAELRSSGQSIEVVLGQLRRSDDRVLRRSRGGRIARSRGFINPGKSGWWWEGV